MPSRDLLLAENLDLVRRELSRPDAVVFGWHYYYAGGHSATPFCFTDFDSYYQEVWKSRPGDHFTVYSRSAILDQALCRIGDPSSNKTISPADIPVIVKEALQAGKEICFLSCNPIPDSDGIECKAGILWEANNQRLHEELRLGSGCHGELLFFLVQKLDEDEAGEVISGVSPGSRRRVNALLDGKRPNEEGMTPASGPY